MAISEEESLRRQLAASQEDLEFEKESHRSEIKMLEEDLQSWRDENRKLEHKIHDLQLMLADNPPPQLVGLRSVLLKWAARYKGDGPERYKLYKIIAEQIAEFVERYYCGRNEMF